MQYHSKDQVKLSTRDYTIYLYNVMFHKTRIPILIYHSESLLYTSRRPHIFSRYRIYIDKHAERRIDLKMKGTGYKLGKEFIILSFKSKNKFKTMLPRITHRYNYQDTWLGKHAHNRILIHRGTLLYLNESCVENTQHCFLLSCLSSTESTRDTVPFRGYK